MSEGILHRLEWHQHPRFKDAPDAGALALEPAGQQLSAAFRALASAEHADSDAWIDHLLTLDAAAAALVRQHPGNRRLIGFVVELSRAIADEIEIQCALTSPVQFQQVVAAALRELPCAAEPMHAWICVSARVAVLVTRHRVAQNAASVPLLGYLGEPAAEFIAAQAAHEAGAWTFVVATPVPGLAGLIQDAIARQTGLLLPVRVRDAQGTAETAALRLYTRRASLAAIG